MSKYCYNVGEPSVSINGGVQISFEPSSQYEVTAIDKTVPKREKLDVALFYTILTPYQIREHIDMCQEALIYLMDEYEKSPMYVITEDNEVNCEDEDGLYDSEEKAKQDAAGMQDIFPDHKYAVHRLTFWEYQDIMEDMYGDYN